MSFIRVVCLIPNTAQKVCPKKNFIRCPHLTVTQVSICWKKYGFRKLVISVCVHLQCHTITATTTSEIIFLSSKNFFTVNLEPLRNTSHARYINLQVTGFVFLKIKLKTFHGYIIPTIKSKSKFSSHINLNQGLGKYTYFF